MIPIQLHLEGTGTATDQTPAPIAEDRLSSEAILTLPAGLTLDRLVLAALYPEIEAAAVPDRCVPRCSDAFRVEGLGLALAALEKARAIGLIHSWECGSPNPDTALDVEEDRLWLVTIWPTMLQVYGETFPLAACRAIAATAADRSRG